MVAAAARDLDDGDTVFVGIGMPLLACSLAKRLHAPELSMVYESGIIGAATTEGEVPTTISDPRSVVGARSVIPQFDNFSSMLQGGNIDVGFLGGAQIDKRGNINSTVIGDYDDPDVRLPGSGGACEIANNSGRIVIITPHETRRFPPEVDFITSPGHVGGANGRDDLGLTGDGPSTVITDKAVMRFDAAGEMYVDQIHPDFSREEIQDHTGWEVRFTADVIETAPPTSEELDILRTELDPNNVYIGGPGE